MFIEAISTFIPDTFVSIENLCQRMGASPAIAQVFSRFHGVKKIPYAGNISYYEMIENPIKPLLKTIDLAQLKYVMFASVITVWPCGHIALAQLQENHKLFDTEIFSMNTHECTSLITAFNVLQALMENEDKNGKSILVASEMRLNPASGLPKIPVNGDASAAIVVSNKKGKHRLVTTHVTSNPQFSMSVWRTSDEERRYQEMFFSMVQSNMEQCLKKTNLDFSSIKCILPVNSSIAAYTALAEQLGISPDRFFTKNIPKTAHCFAADAIINLESALAENFIEQDDYYMMFSIGQSGSFGTAIFQY